MSLLSPAFSPAQTDADRVTGYLTDQQCIAEGDFAETPADHTVTCLLMPECVASGYAVRSQTSPYDPVFQLDPAGNTIIEAWLRSTCAATVGGAVTFVGQDTGVAASFQGIRVGNVMNVTAVNIDGQPFTLENIGDLGTPTCSGGGMGDSTDQGNAAEGGTEGGMGDGAGRNEAGEEGGGTSSTDASSGTGGGGGGDETIIIVVVIVAVVLMVAIVVVTVKVSSSQPRLNHPSTQKNPRDFSNPLYGYDEPAHQKGPRSDSRDEAVDGTGASGNLDGVPGGGGGGSGTDDSEI